MKIAKSESGFSLIEVVIALGVLGFGILAAFSMQTYSIRGNANANKITQEATWGADGLERILDFDYDKIINDGDRPDLTGYLDASLYNVTWTVTPDTPLEDMATIQVNIASLQDGRQVTLQYVKADTAAF